MGFSLCKRRLHKEKPIYTGYCIGSAIVIPFFFLILPQEAAHQQQLGLKHGFITSVQDISFFISDKKAWKQNEKLWTEDIKHVA
jgi:hypothetical protein